MSGKYAYIDSSHLRQSFSKFKTAQSKFDEEVRQWNLELEDEKNSIDRMVAELEKQSLLYSDSEQKSKADSIMARRAALNTKAEEYFGPEGRVAKRNVELTKPLIDEINHALETVANRSGYDLVLDCANGTIAFAPKSLDITDLVLEELERAK